MSLIAAMFLLFSGRRSQQGGIHRYAGRLQAVIVLAVVAPSGLFMSMYAFAGPVAGAGLATLSIATAGCLVFAVRDARLRRYSARLAIIAASHIRRGDRVAARFRLVLPS